MTVSDFFRLLGRTWKIWVIAPIIIMMIVSIISFTLPRNYYAEATVTIYGDSGDLSLVSSLAVEDNRNLEAVVEMDEESEYKVINIIGRSKNGDHLSEDVNQAAIKTIKDIAKLYPRTGRWITYSTHAIAMSKHTIRNGVLSLFGSMLIIILIIFIWALARRSVKSEEDIRLIFDVPVLGQIFPKGKRGGTSPDLILENISFMVPDGEKAIVAGLSRNRRIDEQKYDSFIQNVESCLPSGPLDIQYVQPVDVSSEAARSLHERKNAILAVRAWDNSYDDMQSSLDEIAIADARICGVLLYFD